ncbi:MAG: 50S ribosomal protein L10 [Bacteroidetes bacterium]|nr:50S ribosomal protein L10 [Bacteroidota bacterium]MBX7238541.1 50S ribosomal protein L10 [Bacteroidia bacterium]MCW5918775.1 50S ribosomal protein L10 [Bacteroidota bacterium]HCI58724.1 50S ribosomal protein L10 [Bacteroidota bacterium]HMU77901.1 50S ribosomal protein L10 [Bacteroidia bacterium]
MTREEKNIEIDSLAQQLSEFPNFYITNIESLNSEKTSKLRRLCYSKNVKLRVAKNNLIKKALQKLDPTAYDTLIPTLKGTSAIMFSEVSNVPAKLIKEFRAKDSVPAIKAAWIDSSVFVGDNQLEVLANLKSKNELIAEVIALLQSPAKNVVSQLTSGGSKLAGILKTLEEKGS